MSNQNGFTGGFLAGAIFGGVVGGVLGSVLASRSSKDGRSDNESNSRLPEREQRNSLLNPEGMESARRNLEDKIAQLNDTIDDVREQLHVVNRQEQPSGDRPLNTLDDN